MSDQSLRVAIVGAGPSGLYAAAHLLEQLDVTVHVDLIDRLPTPYGLVRAGVAPDHPEKKLIIDRLFSFHLDHPRIRFFGNCEIGTDITPGELQARYDAVIYAFGANADVTLGIPGEDLPGCHASRSFVGWYNGHPDFRHLQFDLSSRRAVIIGNGNVALDVARILVLPQDVLRKTEIADHALEALSRSSIEEVVILGRRGGEHAAFNNPELDELANLEGVDVLIENADLDGNRAALDWNARRKMETLQKLAGMPPGKAAKRIILRFSTTPLEVLGDTCVTGLRTAAQTATGQVVEDIDTGLVLRSVGYRGQELPGLPFDGGRKVVPSEHGRVIDGNGPVAGAYVTGWIKRGPRGVIGTNKKCALETVGSLLADARAGKLARADHPGDSLEELLTRRKPGWSDMRQWKRIDRAERTTGGQQGRPRVKLASWDELLEAAAV